MAYIDQHGYAVPAYHESSWRRSIGRKTVAVVSAEIDAIVRHSPFLSSSPPVVNDDIETFHMEDIGIGHLLGHGGFSCVHEITGVRDWVGGYHTNVRRKGRVSDAIVGQNGRPNYAIKRLHMKETDKDYESAAIDLASEVLFLTALDHPNIVKVRGLSKGGIAAFERGPEHFFIIMESLETLDSRIHQWREQHQLQLYEYHPRDSPVSLVQKVDYALQIAEALNYLHDRRIIYRDLKPQNVGITSQDTVQIFDFGLCRSLPQGNFHEDETFLMSAVGTRRYMAPELIVSSHYNQKADVYSWSMVFWEMLCLSKPYPHYSSSQHENFVCKRGERPSLYGLPAPVQELLAQSWTSDVRRRLSTKDVCHKLAALKTQPNEELSQITSGFSCGGSQSSLNGDTAVASSSPVYFEIPSHFQHLLQDCDILSVCSDMDKSCMDLTLTTAASTTWHDSTSTIFST